MIRRWDPSASSIGNDATRRKTNVNDEQRQALNAALITREGKRFTRRQALELLGGLGLAAAAFPAISQPAVAQADDHATPHASPVAGPRDDGTNLWKVQVGGMEMENLIDLQTYFPDKITINAGDAIHFAFAPMGMPGFHTVTFTSGEAIPPLQIPDIVDGTPVAAPEGMPRLIINPQVAWTDGREEYDGTGFTNSGIDVFRLEDAPYILTFTTPGTYEYECVIHGIVMKGEVTVQESGADLPLKQADYDALSAERMATLIEEGMSAINEANQETESTPGADGTTMWDVHAGTGGESQARVNQFIPGELTIASGDTVRWTLGSVGEPHTIMFLGTQEQPEDIFVEPQASGPPKFVQNMQTMLPTDDRTFDGSSLRTSGFLGFPPEVAELVGLLTDTYELTFTEPGEYPYYCVFHSGGPEAEGGMTGKIIVEA